jgi:hypothetical protein
MYAGGQKYEMHMEFLHRNFLEDRERERRIIL